MRVRFEYITGIPGRRFSNPVLWGSWDARGAPDQAGSAVAMQSSVAVDGTQVFSAEVDFPLERVTTRYRWGVRLDGPGGTGRWSIVHEVNDESSRGRHRTLVLKREGQVERYYLSRARHLGANKVAGGGARFGG